MKREEINLIKNFLMEDNSILAVYLFGSQTEDKTNKYSDIDIAVLFNKDIAEKDYTDRQIAMMANLSKILNKEVDILILNKAGLFLRYHILKEGIRIYEHPQRNEHNFEAQAIIQYFDFLPIKNRIEQGLLSKIKEA